MSQPLLRSNSLLKLRLNNQLLMLKLRRLLRLKLSQLLPRLPQLKKLLKLPQLRRLPKLSQLPPLLRLNQPLLKLLQLRPLLRPLLPVPENCLSRMLNFKPLKCNNKWMKLLPPLIERELNNKNNSKCSKSLMIQLDNSRD